MKDRAHDRARVLAALRKRPGGIIATDLERSPTIDGRPPMTRVAARVLELRREGHNIPEGERRGAFALYRLVRRGEPTGVRAGYRQVQACRGCEAVRPWRSVCEHGYTARPCLIDPVLNGTGPCQLEERRAVIAWLAARQEVQRAA